MSPCRGSLGAGAVGWGSPRRRRLDVHVSRRPRVHAAEPAPVAPPPARPCRSGPPPRRLPLRCSLSFIDLVSREEAAEGDEGDQGGRYRECLRRGVDGAEDEREDVEDRRGQQGGGDGRAVAAQPAGQCEGEGAGGEQRAGVEDDRRDRACRGGAAEVAGRPDPERLERRELARQVAEPTLVRPIGVQGPEVDEVAQSVEVGRDEHEERQQTRADGDERGVPREAGATVAGIVGERRRRARFPGRRGERAPAPIACDPDQRPDDHDAAEPGEPRERVHVDGPRREDPERDRVAPSAHGR